MMRKAVFLSVLFCLAGAVLFCQKPQTKPADPVPSNPEGPSTTPTALGADSVLITIILKHQQDKNLPEIRRILEAQGFWDMFPPQEAKVISWTIAMGLGHVIILQAPVQSIRRLNLALENGAWGAFSTEIYLSYDYRKVWEQYIEMREEARSDRD